MPSIPFGDSKHCGYGREHAIQTPLPHGHCHILTWRGFTDTYDPGQLSPLP
jgi:hypothetical protein